MKKFGMLAICFLLNQGCDRAPAPAATETKSTATSGTSATLGTAAQPTTHAETLPSRTPAAPPATALPTGSYVGMFGANKMTIVVESYDLATKALVGRSVTAGNDRPFAGTYEIVKGVLQASAKEPGDLPSDGTFAFSISSDALTGKWTPGGKGEAKQFTLARRDFVYNPEVGEYPKFSKTRVSQTDISEFTLDEVRIALNEIYARHGYNFKTKDMRRHFEAQAWYMPLHHDIKKDLTEIETHNIKVLSKYKKFVEEYGTDFGR